MSGGAITSGFIAGLPGNRGLPLNDNDTVINNTFVEGYWSLVSSDGLASTNYDLSLAGDNFTQNSFSVDQATRIVKRADNNSDWTLDGDHLDAINDTVRRASLNGFSEFALADISTCSPPLSTAITGDVNVCANSVNTKYFVDGGNGSAYEWFVAGGIISGTGIAGDVFDPSAAGLGIHEIVYEYTDGNGCWNSDTL